MPSSYADGAAAFAIDAAVSASVDVTTSGCAGESEDGDVIATAASCNPAMISGPLVVGNWDGSEDDIVGVVRKFEGDDDAEVLSGRGVASVVIFDNIACAYALVSVGVPLFEISFVATVRLTTLRTTRRITFFLAGAAIVDGVITQSVRF